MSTNHNIVMLLNSEFKSDARVEREIILLQELGFKIDVVCYENKSLPNEELRSGYKISRVLNRDLSNPLKKSFKKVLNNAIIELKKRDPIILHCHDFEMIKIGSFYKKIADQKVILIYDSHEYLNGWPIYKDAGTFLNKIKTYLVWKALRINEKKAIKSCNFIVTINNEIAKRLKSDNSIKNDPIVLPNIPISKKINDLGFYFHDKFKIDKEKIILVSLGSVYYTQKHLDHLYESILKINSVVLIFIGNFKKILDLKKTVENNEILNQKIFFEDYPKKNLNSILSSADIGICHINTKILSHKIGFSNKFFEYGISGLPIISTKQRVCIEYGKRFNNAIFYDENEQNSFYNSLLEMINNLEMYKSNSKQIREKLDWKKESSKFINLYKKIKKEINANSKKKASKNIILDNL